MARSVAKNYDNLAKVDSSPETISAYKALEKEINDQWDFFTQK